MSEIIVALDVDSADAALRLADDLPDLRWAKVGPMLFLRQGRKVIDDLKMRGVRVFLDLKWHDIPNSVAGAVRAACDLGVDLATVHALGGPKMISAAREASGDMKLVAVTVLTSHSPSEFYSITGRSGASDLGYDVVRLAESAVTAGAHGVVSSPLEVGAIRAALGDDPWIVVPGVRPVGASQEDQQRIATPRAAIDAGATHLVVGRPITRAKRPAEVYDGIRSETEVSW